MNPFSLARTPELIFGAGEIVCLGECLSRLGAADVLVVVSPSAVADVEVRAGIARVFEEAGITASYVRYDSLPGTLGPFEAGQGPYREASPDVVDAVVAATDQCPQAIVAIGGGSAIDTGKALSAAFLEEGSITDYLEGVGTRAPSGRKVPFVAVPTTAGTGSEATANAVLSRQAAFKKSLRHARLVPDVALVDPGLQLSCPRAQTAASGLDAITQLLEAYLSRTATPFTDALALDGLAAAGRSFLPAVERGDSDVGARAGMAYAAWLSGVCLANAGLGTVHGLAGAAGALAPVPHGVFCGALLPHVVERTIEAVSRRRDGSGVLSRIAAAGRALSSQSGGSLEAQMHLLVDRLVEFARVADLPRLSEYGMDTALARVIAEAGNNKQHPHEFDVDERYELLERAL